MSRIVDILDADWQRYRNHRYGRDYYTKQASLPSGRTKSDESDGFSWTSDEEALLHRAEPVATTDDDFHVQSFKNHTEITEATPHWNVNDQQNQEDSSDLSFIQCYNVQNSKIHYEPFQDGEKKLKIQVNVSPELHFITECNINSNIDLNENSIKELVVTLNGDINKENKKQENDTKVVFSPKIGSNLPNARIKNEENETFKETFVTENLKDNRNLFVATKKSDNTWIKKIYSNPIVRNFALTNREQVPWITDEESSKTKINPTQTESNTKTSSTTFTVVETITDNSTSFSQSNLEKDTNDYEKEELSTVHNFSLEFSDNESSREENLTTYDNDCNELKERRLVANRLGEFSKAFPNLLKTRVLNNHQPKENVSILVNQDTEDKLSESTQSYEGLISVKDLKKLFEKNEVQQSKNKPVHSLTARSISKEVKQKLSNYDNK